MLRFCLQTYRFEQFVNVISNEQGVSQNAHDLNNRPSDFMLVLNDSDETVCDDGNMDLYAYGIFTLTPKVLTLRCCLIHLKKSSTTCQRYL